MRFSGTTLVAITFSAITAACGGSTADDTGTTMPSAGGASGVGAGGSGAAGSSAAGTSAKGGGAGTTGSAGTSAAGGSGTAGSDPGTGGSDPGTGGSDPGTGGAGGDPGTAGAGGDAGAAPFETAPHPAYPTIQTGTGVVLSKVQLVTITYAGWTGIAHAEAFGDAIVQSEWLATVGADYGVGKGDHIAKVQLNETAPATISDFQIDTLITSHISNGTLPKPPTKNDYLYVIYFPATTVVTQGANNGKGCAQQGFGGFHTATQVGSARVAYAVIPGCQSTTSIETSVSHELIEAATDPVPFPGSQSYRINGGDIWAAPAGGEVGDVCNSLDWKEGGFTYQRSWSKSAAAAGQEPCIPTTAGIPSFSVAPSPSATIAGVAGQATTLTLTGWSDAPMANWHLSVVQFTGDFQANVKFSSFLINNGFTSDMTVTVPATAPHGSNGDFFIASTYMGEAHYWPIKLHVK